MRPDVTGIQAHVGTLHHGHVGNTARQKSRVHSAKKRTGIEDFPQGCFRTYFMQLVGTTLIVLCKAELTSHIRNVEAATKKVGPNIHNISS